MASREGELEAACGESRVYVWDLGKVGVSGDVEALAAVLFRFLYSLMESDFLCDDGVFVVSVKGGGRVARGDSCLEVSPLEIEGSSSFRFCPRDISSCVELRR